MGWTVKPSRQTSWKGSSSGKDGMKLKLEQPIYKAGPITQRAK